MAGTSGVPDKQMPWENAAAFLGEVVEGGGSRGRAFDIRQGGDGAWDVVLLLDGGYAERADAVDSLEMNVDFLRRAYVAEVEAGRIQPAGEADLAKIGLRAE